MISLKLCPQIKVVIGLVLFNAVNYCFNKVIFKFSFNVKHLHEKKLVDLHQDKRKLYGKCNTLFISSTVYKTSQLL